MRLARLNSDPEIFYSLQGEGASSGRPSVFVRLYGCNLACGWCDTAYAWDGATGSTVMDVAEVAARVRGYDCGRLVITGGEPMLQQRDVARLLELLPDHFCEVETNGTIYPGEGCGSRVGQFNVSPKLEHSGNDVARAINEEALIRFATEAEGRSWFKFVVADETDMDAVVPLAERCRMERSRVILMPRASSLDELNRNREPVAALALRHGYCFSDRLHMTLWREQKGV